MAASTCTASHLKHIKASRCETDGQTDGAAASSLANPADALSPVCLRAWAMSEDDTEKDMPHRSHWYGRSPVWRRL